VPAAIVRTDEAIFRCILVPVKRIKPGPADERGVEKQIHFLAVVVGLGVKVAVS
jgi:hypothetical protein